MHDTSCMHNLQKLWIQAEIKEVMGDEAYCLTKFKMAFTICTTRLAELRAEERRRV